MEAITKEFKFGSLEFGSKFDYYRPNHLTGGRKHPSLLPDLRLQASQDLLRAMRTTTKGCEDYGAMQRDQLRSIVGSLNCMVRVCRVDIAYRSEVTYLQAVMQQAVVGDLIAFNDLSAYATKIQHHRRFPRSELRHSTQETGASMRNCFQSGRIRGFDLGAQHPAPTRVGRGAAGAGATETCVAPPAVPPSCSTCWSSSSISR